MEKPKVERIKPREGSYKISRVLDNGKNATYEIFEKLTEPMTLPDLSEYSARQKEMGNPYVLGAEEFWSVLTEVVNSEDASLIQDIQKKLRENEIRMLTTIYGIQTSLQKLFIILAHLIFITRLARN